VMGEGCGLVCLETLDHARKRGAHVYCEVAGWGLAASPSPPTGRPDSPRGFLLSVQRALAAAGDGPPAQDPAGERNAGRSDPTAAIDLIQGAGNGGRRLDALEAAAYEQLWGAGGASPRITSLKGATGEIFASGGIRAAALALSIEEGIVPPVAGLTTPLSSLPFVVGTAERRPVNRALLSGISFGGTYACLVFTAPPRAD